MSPLVNWFRVTRRFAQSNLLVDALTAALLAGGTAAGLFHIVGLDSTIWPVLAASLVLTAFLTLLSRRWWLVLLILCLPAAVAALVLYRLDNLADVLNYLADFGRWSITWLQLGLPDPAVSIWKQILPILLILPFSAIWLLIVRRIDHLLVPASLLLVIFLPLLIWYPAVLPDLLLALAGLIMQLPRHFTRLVQHERPLEGRLPRAPMQLLALPVAILSLLLAQSLIPTDTHGWRWPALVSRISDIQDFFQNRFGSTQGWQPFSIAAFGFQPEGGKLGGPVILDRETVLLVKTEQAIPLKGISRSIYTGSSWERAASGQYRFASNLWWLFRQRAFDQNLPGGATGRTFRRLYGRQIKLDIEPQTSYQSTLFYAGHVSQISLDNSLDYPPYFTTTGDLFVYGGLPRDHHYTVESEYFDRRQAGFDQALLAIEQSAAAAGDSNWPDIRTDYLQVPANLPATIAAAADAAVDPAASPYQKALDLQLYFQTGFTYTLTPDSVPENTDFVASFLQTRAGYCVHFATAMVVMARTLGIPARYVEGFLLKPASSSTPDSGYWQAAGNTAHAWAELYFAGIGWLTFDPTPGNSINDPLDPGQNQDLTPTPQPSLSPAITASPTPTPDENVDQNQGAAWYWLISVLILLLLAGRILLTLIQKRHRRRFDPAQIKKRYFGPSRRLEFYYRDLLRQMACLSIKPDSGETLSAFAARAEGMLRISSLALPEVLWPVICWRYGAVQPDESDLTRIADLHRRLEERLQESLSRTAYLFRRVLPAWRDRTRQ